ncbi:MAG: DUF368 domain-containing protein [Pseudomonadota bacterium]
MNTVAVYVRGMLMGAADIVPGVSGGTIAFITGIYDKLLASIRAFDLKCLSLLLAGDIRGVWMHVNGRFLLALVLGIGTSILSLARLISWTLEQHPTPLWAFFFGLILASALVLLKQVEDWSVGCIASLLVGTVLAAAIALSPSVNLDIGPIGIFLSGFLAICAMILPGISGSFILILLGMYGVVLEGVTSFDVPLIAVFLAGCVAGLLCFSRLLHWLLLRFHQATMAMLTGFLIGSLLVVWPWKHVLKWVAGSQGQLKPAHQVPISPGQFLAQTGQEPALLLCLSLMLVGFVLVWLIDHFWGADTRKSSTP